MAAVAAADIHPSGQPHRVGGDNYLAAAGEEQRQQEEGIDLLDLVGAQEHDLPEAVSVVVVAATVDLA